jgi:hypothetical protein
MDSAEKSMSFFAACKALASQAIAARLKRLRKKSPPDGEATPQGLKPDVFSIVYGPTKVVP